MATTKLGIGNLGDIQIQTGRGNPNHNSYSGTVYLDKDTGFLYRGISGTTWQYIGSTYSYLIYDFSVGSSSGGTQNGLNYYVSGSTPTATQSGDRWFNINTGIELVWINDGDSGQWIQPFSVPGPESPNLGYYSVTGISTSQTITWDKTYWGISGTTNIDLILPTTSSKDGYYLIIKDEIGNCGTYRIRVISSSGLIDGNSYIDMNINYMSLTFMVRGGNWYLI